MDWAPGAVEPAGMGEDIPPVGWWCGARLVVGWWCGQCWSDKCSDPTWCGGGGCWGRGWGSGRLIDWPLYFFSPFFWTWCGFSGVGWLRTSSWNWCWLWGCWTCRGRFGGCWLGSRTSSWSRRCWLWCCWTWRRFVGSCWLRSSSPHTSWASIYQPFVYSTVCMCRNSVLTYGRSELTS